MSITLNKYNEDRFELLSRMASNGIDFEAGNTWLVDPAQMRFCLGESLEDMKVPYYLTAHDESAIRNTILTLAMLIKERQGPSEAEAEEEKSVSYRQSKISLMKKSYKTDIFVQNSIEKISAIQILSFVPYIDSGILRNWLALEGDGAAFIRLTVKIIEKAIEEEIKQSKNERTSYLALLAIINTTKKAKELLKDFKIKGFTYEKLELTISLSLFFLLKAVINDVLVKCQNKGISYGNRIIDDLLCASLTPQSFLYIHPNILLSTINPYSINKSLVDAFTDIFEDIYRKEKDVFNVAETMLKVVNQKRPLVNSIVELSRVIGLREILLTYLVDYDTPGLDAHKAIHDVYQEDRLIYALLKDAKKKEEFIDELEGLKCKYMKDLKRVGVIDSIQRYMTSKKGYSLLSRLGVGRSSQEDLLRPIIKGFITYKLDSSIEKYVGVMRDAIIDRKKEFSKSTLDDEYARGRLYRFSSDESLILMLLELEEEGHLFIDMKDFTKKMLRVKEIAMAEFMKEHFYKPMLDSASRYSKGSGLLKDVRGIQLNNVVGDGALFSGGIENLVSLADDIRKITSDYKEQLKRRLLPLRKSNLNYGDRDGHDNLLVGQQEAVADTRNVERLEEVISQGLEVGLFITYGKKAESFVLHMKKGFAGEIKVAIGERINEAARGACRNQVVRIKNDMMLEREKNRKGNPDLLSPFDVYVGSTYGMRMTPELDSAIEELITSGDLSRVKELVQVIANKSYDDLKGLASGKPFSNTNLFVSMVDIYNKGHAISGDALKAYISETRGTKRFFKEVVAIMELHVDIRDSFFIPMDPLEFFFGIETREGVEVVDIFSKIGSVTFKGFEMAPPTEVYEILDREGDFYKLIMNRHFERWHEEAVAKPNV